MTDAEIVKRINDKLSELRTDVEEIESLRDTYSTYGEYSTARLKIASKVFLLEEILGIE